MDLSAAISLNNLLCICICVQRCVHGCSWSFVYNNKGLKITTIIRGLTYSILTLHNMKQHVHIFKKRVLNIIIQNIIAKIYLKNKKVKVQKSVYRMLMLFPNISFVHSICFSVLKGSPLCHQMCESFILQSDCKLQKGRNQAFYFLVILTFPDFEGQF